MLYCSKIVYLFQTQRDTPITRYFFALEDCTSCSKRNERRSWSRFGCIWFHEHQKPVHVGGTTIRYAIPMPCCKKFILHVQCLVNNVCLMLSLLWADLFCFSRCFPRSWYLACLSDITLFATSTLSWQLHTLQKAWQSKCKCVRKRLEHLHGSIARWQQLLLTRVRSMLTETKRCTRRYLQLSGTRGARHYLCFSILVFFHRHLWLSVKFSHWVYGILSFSVLL